MPELTLAWNQPAGSLSYIPYLCPFVTPPNPASDLTPSTLPSSSRKPTWTSVDSLSLLPFWPLTFTYLLSLSGWGWSGRQCSCLSVEPHCEQNEGGQVASFCPSPLVLSKKTEMTVDGQRWPSGQRCQLLSLVTYLAEGENKDFPRHTLTPVCPQNK